MCDIRSKITRYAKKQQNETHYKHKNQSTETDPELTQMLDLADNDIKHYYHYITYILKVKRYQRYQKGYIKFHKLCK